MNIIINITVYINYFMHTSPHPFIAPCLSLPLTLTPLSHLYLSIIKPLQSCQEARSLTLLI